MVISPAGAKLIEQQLHIMDSLCIAKIARLKAEIDQTTLAGYLRASFFQLKPPHAKLAAVQRVYEEIKALTHPWENQQFTVQFAKTNAMLNNATNVVAITTARYENGSTKDSHGEHFIQALQKCMATINAEHKKHLQPSNVGEARDLVLSKIADVITGYAQHVWKKKPITRTYLIHKKQVLNRLGRYIDPKRTDTIRKLRKISNCFKDQQAVNILLTHDHPFYAPNFTTTSNIFVDTINKLLAEWQAYEAQFSIPEDRPIRRLSR